MTREREKGSKERANSSFSLNINFHCIRCHSSHRWEQDYRRTQNLFVMWYYLSTLTTTAAFMLILSRTVCGTDWMDYSEPMIDVDATYDDQLLTALARDQEHEIHSSFITGYKHVSGGAGEGKQHLSPNGEIPNHPEVKTDEELPSYCHPPNPCPLGFEGKILVE